MFTFCTTLFRLLSYLHRVFYTRYSNAAFSLSTYKLLNEYAAVGVSLIWSNAFMLWTLYFHQKSNTSSITSYKIHTDESTNVSTEFSTL